MVQYKVITTKQALEELQEIVAYLLENSSIATAQSVSNGILNTIKTLEKMPGRHPVLKGLSKKKHEYRFAIKWAYKIIYRIENDPPIVKVITIFHDRQNPSRLEALLG